MKYEIVTKISKLEKLSKKEQLEKVTEIYPFKSNNYYLSLINWEDEKDPIKRLIIPNEYEITETWGSFPQLKNGDRVLLKPNLLSGKPPETAVTTHPIILEAMIQILLDRGCKITVGDSPALHPFARVIKKTGLSPLGKRYPIQFQDLDTPVVIDGIKGGIYQSFEISRHCFETDYLLSLAKFKTHSMMGLTLSVKNLFGCIPGRRKAAWHLAIGKNRKLFARMLAELAAVISADFYIIDGIVGMEGNGPGNGTPIPLGVLLGG
jgi:uncharacterized protein (DUF362 family)